MTTRSAQVEIPSELRAVGSLVSRVREVLIRAGISTATAEAMELCLAECANNIIEHGYRLDSSQRVRVDLSIDHDSISLAVLDRAAPFDPRERLVLAADFDSVEAMPERGMGCSVIGALIDDVHYETTENGNRTTLVKKLRPEDLRGRR